MKHLIKRMVIFLITTVLLTACVVITALGAEYSDISGHWAEETLTKAVEDTLLEGSGNTLEPDAPITGAEMVSILTRVFSAEQMADLSAIDGISPGDWYYNAAAKAVAMGILIPENNRLDLSNPVKRYEAFACLAEAFQLVDAAQDTSIISKYSDSQMLLGKYRQFTAALVADGYIEGYGGALHINDEMTRAEFVTVLYKIASEYVDDVSTAADTENMVITGDTELNGSGFSGNLYFDCSSSEILLRNLFVPNIVIRSESLKSLTLYTSNIDRLVFACGSNNMTFSPNATNTIDTVVVGPGSGKIDLGGRISYIEITGDNRDIIVNTSVIGITVTGSGNRILINPGVTVNSIKTLTEASDNIITVNGYCALCDLYGSNTAVDGKGTVVNLNNNAESNTIFVSALNMSVNDNYGLNGVTITLTAPDDLTSYEMLEAEVNIEAPEKDIICVGHWFLNDDLIASEDINLSEQSVASLSFDASNYREDLPVTATLTFILSYSNTEGVYQELYTEKSLTLESRNKFSAQEVLSLVTTGYKGDYTLAWAETNDFEDVLKEEWINIKGYSSNTDYLLWVSIAYQRVNVFTGSAGHWTLEKTFIVGTGAPGHATPTGVFSVLAKRTTGWTTSQYTVEPLINFYSSAYAFHSRLYYPNTTTVMDPRIGFPISHGCVRMYDEDLAYLFDTIPVGTTVVIY